MACENVSRSARRSPPRDFRRSGRTGPVGWRLAAVAGRRPLRQVLEVRTRRRPFSLRIGGEEVAEVALDDTVGRRRPRAAAGAATSGRGRGGSRWVDDLEPLVRDLRTASGLQPATLSKFEAGLLALGVTIPGPPDLGPTEVVATSTLGDLAYAMLRRHLAVLLAKEPGTRSGRGHRRAPRHAGRHPAAAGGYRPVRRRIPRPGPRAAGRAELAGHGARRRPRPRRPDRRPRRHRPRDGPPRRSSTSATCSSASTGWPAGLFSRRSTRPAGNV